LRRPKQLLVYHFMFGQRTGWSASCSKRGEAFSSGENPEDLLCREQKRARTKTREKKEKDRTPLVVGEVTEGKKNTAKRPWGGRNRR